MVRRRVSVIWVRAHLIAGCAVDLVGRKLFHKLLAALDILLMRFLLLLLLLADRQQLLLVLR